MKIDEADMASATDVGRNTGRYIAQAADGRRVVIMNNHQPVAAIIGMADLRRLDALDIPAVGAGVPTPPQKVTLTDLEPRTGWIPVGLTSAGQTAYIDPLKHLLVAGKDASDMIGPLLAGVAIDGLDAAFVVASDRPVVIAHPDGPRPRVVALATGTDDAGGDRIAEHIAGELDARSRLLRRHKANSIDHYRRFHDGPPIDHLIVVIDSADSLLRHHSLSNVVRESVQRGASLDVSVWLFSETLIRDIADVARDTIEQRLALATRTSVESRDVIGNADAVDLLTGQAILWTGTDTQTGIATFIRDDAVAPEPLETVGPPVEWPSTVQPPTIQELMHLYAEEPRAKTCFEAPIGILDDLHAHRLVPFSLEFVSGAANIAHGYKPDSHSTQILLDALLASSAQRYRPNELQFHYIGHDRGHLCRGPARDLPHLASAHRWSESTSALASTITEAIDTDSGAHTVLIVDDWRPLESPEHRAEVEDLREVIRRVFQMPNDENPGVHVLVICYGSRPPRDHVLMTKSLSYVHLSDMDHRAAIDSTTRAVLGRLPDSPHHAAVSQKHLVLATV